MGESVEEHGCRYREPRFKGRLYVGKEVVRTITMPAPPRVGDEILYHDRYGLPLERWLVKRMAWQITKETGWTWFHAEVERVAGDDWPPLTYP